ncbi:ribosomal RNA small subunit methyltransferase E [Companilactobacillus sp. RD055328]|uniref:RsmE family RNA methyltransferase n=1 Tax=Companilactobacillus sp. RD055328 TaxID=2916634 RepID=UPI001FC8395D|nr:RsmE family RNA methyltransferase [Companilactobacillus sp. RD055328]GKQ42644.1 ribosomal RNA small subunit methyltransferase E [Companilactobacillus sp. RD055328]
MQQYFINEIIPQSSDKIEILDNDLYKHLIKVLRMKIGDECLLVDTHQHRVKAVLRNYEESLEFDLKELTDDIDTEFPIIPIIACALSKKDKLEWIAQKSTEMGVKKIIFFDSRFSVMKWDEKSINKKLSRLQEIVKNAAQQSHRKLIPEVLYVKSLKELIKSYEDIDYKLVAYEEVAKKGQASQLSQVFDKLDNNQSIMCLFGPEGGFDPTEIDLLVKHNYLKVGLGPRILRAETAPLYFLGVLSYKFDLALR